MRLLFTSTPGTGHVLHMLPLAHAAMARGHDVHWAIGADAHALLARAGVPDRGHRRRRLSPGPTRLAGGGEGH